MTRKQKAILIAAAELAKEWEFASPHAVLDRLESSDNVFRATHLSVGDVSLSTVTRTLRANFDKHPMLPNVYRVRAS